MPGLGFVVVVLVFVLVGDDVMHLWLAPMPSADPLGAFRILPALDQLPSFAILRAVPSKTPGLAAAFALLLLPLVAPWMRAWRFHVGPARAIWTVLWIGLVANWLALGLIGASAPSDAGVLATWALVAYQPAFFLAAPPLLARITPPATDLRDAVFD